MKSSINIKKLVLILLPVFFFLSCQKEIVPTPEPEPEKPELGNSFSVQANCQFRQDDASLTSIGWTKIFEDNFESGLSQWKTLTGGSKNNQLQYYQSANLQVKDGSVQITAKRETVQGPTHETNSTPKTFNFTSGAIASLTKFSIGTTTSRVRVAFRAKLPVGKGMSPVIYSSSNPWPIQGQIIMLQSYGDRPNYYETNYHYGTTEGKNLVRDVYGFITADLNLTECYHVYEMEWSQNALKFYLDGNLVETKTSGGYISSLFGKEHYLFFTLAVNGAVPIDVIEPGTLSIDWVKVFKAS